MCGIAGVFQRDGRGACPEQLWAMIAQVRHRGPDAAEVLVDDPVGLAHARLSILDPANGRQPMRTADGALAITFNGEIFNHVELRETLRACGHRFRTRSDTEVILHAYREYGEKCVDHLNGQWAFAIWDKPRQALFLSRDRLGIHPLFTTECQGRFLFASEVKSLFVVPEVRRELDPRGLSQLFTLWTPLPPTTVFRDIEELPPGHNLLVTRNGRRCCRYWQLDFSSDRPGRAVGEWSEELRALLTDATRLRMRADVPVAAYVSGGLDSAVTAALARQVAGDRLRTFSVAFDDDEFDESRFQRVVVDHLGTSHESLCCRAADIARVFPDVVWHAEKPMLRTAPAPLFLLAKLVRETGTKVVLTGEGADEVLGGYDLFKEAKVRRFVARQPNSLMRQTLFAKLYPYLPGFQAQSAAMSQAFFRAGPEDLADPLFSHLPRWNTTSQLRRFLEPGFDAVREHGTPYDWVRDALPADFARWDSFCQAQYLETAILLPGYILSSQGDRVALAHSVEGRFPFLDHRLVEFAATLPPRLKMKGLREKHLLKRVARDLVPLQTIARSKQPYRAPDAKCFFSADWRSAAHDYVDELLSPRRVRSAGVFRPDSVEHLLRKIRSGKATSIRDNMALVGILSTQILIDQFVENFSSHQRQPAGPPAVALPDSQLPRPEEKVGLPSTHAPSPGQVGFPSEEYVCEDHRLPSITGTYHAPPCQ